MGADTKANTTGAAAHLSEVTALPLSASHELGDALGGVGAFARLQ